MHKKKLGFISIILLGLNGIIGSGIFLLPNQIAKLVGNGSFGIIIFDAGLVTSIAFCFAQAASYFKEDGGAYLYAQSAFGNFVGFEVGFVTWAICIIAQATMSAALKTELVNLFPNLAPYQNWIVSALLIFLAFLNIGGVQISKWLINLTSIAKLTPLILFIVIGLFFIHPNRINALPFSQKVVQTNFNQAALTMFYAFTGFESMVLAAGEMRHVQKNLPRAIILVIGSVASLYLLIQIVAAGTLGKTLGITKVPVQASFTQIAGRTGYNLVGLGTLLSMAGLLVTSSFVTPRAAVALAAHQHLPQILNWRNQYHAPFMAILVSTGLSLIIMWFGNFSALAQISAVSRFAQYLPTCLAVLVFQKTKTLHPQQFHLWGGPVIPLIAIVVSCWLLSKVSTAKLLAGLGALFIGVPIYLLMHFWKRHNAHAD
ncbi:APC family permease [Bombilactobacillus folatiphilus]|uniref:APC family permease n=1 Tax=Bombilactobacillus folatiphilus TaxID=2923362 RepID=A0ABY4P8J1_9LACO|nr:APC family permease [Bombilactobacillus folatiphilus]UQS81962.1 APC family permease [Bombilactobacillus folatiphilus]